MVIDFFNALAFNLCAFRKGYNTRDISHMPRRSNQIWETSAGSMACSRLPTEPVKRHFPPITHHHHYYYVLLLSPPPPRASLRGDNMARATSCPDVPNLGNAYITRRSYCQGAMNPSFTVLRVANLRTPTVDLLFNFF
jgi:hypothetical protein